MTDEHKCQSTEQIDRLAKFLLANFQDDFGGGPEPGQGEGAVEMAMRLMKEYPELRMQVKAVESQHQEIKEMVADLTKKLES